MATGSQVNVGVNITATGLKEANKDAGQLHANLKGAAEAAQKVRVPGPVAAARQGVAAQRMESQQYGVARGSIGTGAEGRDFAKQSQGLGGLVRLYATYAANLFAVSAAFGALSKAADTTNMVKGLDQLGAKGGMALGSISKQLMAATDNAISFRDAMSATAKVTAAGLGGDTVLRIGQAAKSASQALGIDMSDAVSRLSRGITKLEPELLDELGIFIRIDDVVQKYATSVGKSSSAITDFEKRTAVANAVLTQAEQKFGAIKIDANPYNQLSASIQNLTQNILELVNKVLGPLINTLASSPTALLTALSGIGLVLVKQALPALGEFKAGLQSAADKAQEISINKGRDALKARESLNKQIEAQLGDSLDKQVDRVDVAQAKIDTLQLNTAEKGTKAYKALSKNIHEITDSDIAVMQRRAKLLEKQGQVDIAKGYKEAIPAILAAQKGEADLNALRETNARNLEKDAKGWTTYGLTVQAARKAEVDATKSAIISNAAYRGSLIGVTGAYTLMRQELDKTDLSKFQKGLALAQGTTAAFFGKLGTLLGRLGMIGEIAALAIGGFTLLNSALTSNSKETAKFTSDVNVLNSAVSNSAEVLKLYSTIDYSSSFPIDLLRAASTAISEINTGIKNLVKSTNELDSAAGNWDRFIDGWLTVIGKDIKSTSSRNIAAAISASIETAPAGPAKEAFKEKLSEILKVKDLGKDNILDVLADTKSPEEFKAKLKALSEASAEFSKAQGIAAAKTLELDAAFSNTNTAFLALTNSFSNTSPLQKFGQSLLDESQKITAALESPEKGLANLAKLATDTNRITLFSPETFDKIKTVAPEVEKINKEIVKQDQIIADRKIQLQKETNQFTISELKGILANAEKRLAELKQRGKEISENILQAVRRENFITAGKIMGQEIAAAGVQASLTIRKAYAGFLTGEAAIKENTKIAVAEINNRTSLIQATLDLIKSNYALQATNQKKLAYDIQTGKDSTPEQVAAATKDFEKYKAQEEVFSSKDPGKTAASFSAELMADAQSKLQSLANLQKQITQNNAERASQFIIEARELGAESGRQLDLVLAKEIALKNEKLKQLNLQEQINGQVTQESMLAKQGLQDDILALEGTKALAENYGRIVGLNEALVLARKQKVPGQEIALQAEIAKELAKIEQKNAETADKQRTNALEDSKTKLDFDLSALDKTYNVKQGYTATEERTAQVLSDIEARRIESLAETLELRKQLGTISAEDLIVESARLKVVQDTNAAEIAKQSIRQQAKQTVDAAQQEIDKLALLRKENKGLTANQQDQLFLQMAIKNVAESNANAAISDINKQLAARNSITLAIAEQNVMQERQNELLAKMAGFADTLTNAFGELGTAIGKSLQALINISVEDENYLKRKKALQEQAAKFNEGSDPQEVAKNLKDQKKLENDRAKSELANIGVIASASKKMFGEKTAAYRILSGIERAHTVMTLALQAKELAMTIANTAKGISARVPGIFASFMDQLGVFGPPAAAAAIAAFIGGAFGGRGGSTVDMTGKTASERQASQGTGTVTGDNTAKSQSLENSLEILTSTSVEGLSYSNRMVELLTEINKGIGGVAKGVYGVVGLTSGSQFGTTEGTSGYSFLGGLFGDKTTREITDAGLALKGTFANFIAGSKDFVQTYEDVLTTSTSSFLWFSSTSQSLNTQLKELDPKVAKAISGVFKNAGEAFIEAGKGLGMTQQNVMDMLATVDLTRLISLRGLKGAELEEALTASISAMLDTAAETVFSQVEEFNKFGEGMLQTAVRVTDGLSKVNLAMQSIGKEAVGSYLGGVRISEALIDAAGGLSNFIDKTKSFNSKFLTEAERLAPIQAAVNKELNSLGYASNLTREQFKQLVLGFKVTDDASAITYNKLLNLVDGVDELATASENAAKKLKTDTQEQLIKIYTLLDETGRDLLGSEKALALTRQRELEALTDILKPGQIYINALQDEKDLKTRLTTAYTAESTAIKSTITSLKASIKTIKDYKAALTAGAISTLTPAEKYAQAKAAFTDTAALARTLITSTSSPEEIAARDAAVSQLSSTSDTFLNASKELFASSGQYTQDFSTVMDILDTTSGTLSDQEDNAKKQLVALDASVASLNLIKTNTETTAKLLGEYLTAQSIANAARTAYETASVNTTTNAATTVSTAVTNAATSISTANDAVTNSAATTVADAITGTTATSTAVDSSATAITEAIRPTGTEGGGNDNGALGTGWGDKTPAERAAFYAENPAMGKLTRGITEVFAYTTLGAIVNAVRDEIDPGARIRDLAESYGIDTSNGGLGEGMDNTGVGVRAMGGYSPPGTYLVGEQGPELVDFKTPGQVYTAKQTFGMFTGNNQALLEEIKALRQEVTQLRAEQKEQTGHIISTNYDANNRNAEMINSGNQEVSANALWTDKLKVALR